MTIRLRQEALILWGYRHFFGILAATIAGFAAALYYAQGLKIDTDFWRMQEGDPSFEDMLEARNQFGDSSPLIAVIRSDNRSRQTLLDFRRELHARLAAQDDLKLMPGVAGSGENTEQMARQLRAALLNQDPPAVQTFLQRLEVGQLERQVRKARRRLVTLSDAALREAVANDLLDIYSLIQPFVNGRSSEKLRQAVTGSEEGGPVISVIQPSGSAENSQYCIELLSRLERAVRATSAKIDPDETIAVDWVGPHVLTGQSSVILQREMMLISVGAGLALFVVLLLTLRRFAMAWMVIVPLWVAMALIFLVARLFFNPIYFITIGFVAIVLGLGLDFSLHLTAALHTQLHQASSREDALIRTLSECTKPLFIGVTSTCMVFLALLFSGKSALIEFATLTSIGLGIIFAVTLALFPALARYWAPAPSATAERRSVLILPTALLRCFVRHQRTTFVLGVVLLLASLPIAARFRFDLDLMSLFPRNMPELNTIAAFERDLDASITSSFQIFIDAPNLETAMVIQRQVDRLLQERIENGSVAWFESPSNFRGYPGVALPARIPDVTHLEPNFKSLIYKYHIKSNPSHDIYLDVLRKTASLLRDPSDEPASTHIARYDRGTRLRTSVWPSSRTGGNTPFSTVTSAEIEAQLDSIELPRNTDVQLLGTAELLESLQSTIKAQFGEISWIALALVAVFVLICFREWAPTLMTFIPLAGAIPLMFAVIVLSHVPLTPMTIALIAIVIGIGIDDSVHLLTRVRRGSSVNHVVRQIGPVITLTTLSTAIGFGCLMLSSHPVVYSLGQAILVGVLACWLFTFCLLPLPLSRYVKNRDSKCRQYLWIPLLIGIPIASPTQNDDVDRFLSKLQKKVKQERSVSCSFTTTKWLSQLEGPVRLEGSLLYQHPGCFRIETSGDEELLILTSGFAKKTQKTPRQEIALAEKRKRDYLRRR